MGEACVPACPEHARCLSSRCVSPVRPHLLLVVADDLGLHDVPFTRTGSEIRTPALSSLAAAGLVLDNYYVQPLCTPTRAALLTGRHPVQLGLQHGVIRDAVPDAVPANETMLPQLLRAAGYRTHHVGKWHLGFHQKRYTPERRGFDTSLGYYTGNAEYWNHTSPCWDCGNYTALDLHEANATSWRPITTESGRYSTELFTSAAVDVIERHAATHGVSDGAPPLFLYLAYQAVHGASSCFTAPSSPPDCAHPADDELQAPRRHSLAQSHIAAGPRRAFAAMVGALDDGVANVSAALLRTAMAPRALLLFTSDNGAPHTHLGGAAMSNWPLRGGKGELWEGGVRAAAFLWGGALPPAARGARSRLLCHAADWLPTFARLAAAPLPAAAARGLYGVELWGELARGGEAAAYAARGELLHNIDSRGAALRLGDLKLLAGAAASGWGRRPADAADAPPPPPPRGAVVGLALFNVTADWREERDLAGDGRYRGALEAAVARLEALRRLAVPPRDAPPDARARPAAVRGLSLCTPSPRGPILCDEPIGVWQPWQPDGEDPEGEDPEGCAATPSSEPPEARFAGRSWRVAPLLFAAAAAAFLVRAVVHRARQWLERDARLKAVAALDDEAEDDAAAAAEAADEAAAPRHLQCAVFLLRRWRSAGLTYHAVQRPQERRCTSCCAVGGFLALAASAFLLARQRRTIAPPPLCPPAAAPALNSIVLFLTDDQSLDSFPSDPAAPTPLHAARRHLSSQGATASHFFASSPICCPSRAQLLTGRYLHNLKVRGRASPPAASCMHVNLSLVENSSFAATLARAGYTVGMFGKYLNRWSRAVPRGVHAFFANGGGSYVAPRFTAANLHFAGIPDGEWVGGADDYSTAAVGNLTVRWLHHVAPLGPFFAYVAPKAAHEPFVAAPWYDRTWSDGWPRHERRGAAWNASAAGRHASLDAQPRLSARAAAVVSEVFRNRWRTLLSVDDLVDAVLRACEERGALESTFFFFTSDNGFTLGQFGLPMDKRHVYDFDVRIPLVVRGPGILPGSRLAAPATIVDLAPTFLMIAGVPARHMDGRSLLPLLLSREALSTLDAANATPHSPQALEAAERSGVRHLALPALHALRLAGHQPWRESVLLEHLYWHDPSNIPCADDASCATNVKCMANCTAAACPDEAGGGGDGSYPSCDLWCTDLRRRRGCWGTLGGKLQRPSCSSDCYPTEDRGNNFIALRRVYRQGEAADALYAHFRTGDQGVADVDFSGAPDFVEYYNMRTDEEQLSNLGDEGVREQWPTAREELLKWHACERSSCP